jgi:hypothetical protein
VIITSYGFGQSLKQTSAELAHIDDFIPVLYLGSVTDNLNQVVGTGYTFELFIEWLDESQ